MTIVGSGSYRYELNETWAQLPNGWTFGQMSAVATDSQDRVYAFQRKDPPIVVFRPRRQLPQFLGEQRHRRPHGEFHLPHSLWVDRQNNVHVCDRENSRIQVFTATGKFVAQWAIHKPTDIYFDAQEIAT